MRGLYAIVDVGTLAARGLDPVAFAEAVLVARPAALQLRSKDPSSREALALLRALAPMCHQAGVPLVANDRPDFAVLAGCDLVHVGQTDMPIERVRRIAPQLRVGVSTHTLDQLDAALAVRPAYVAYGPVFETRTKANPDPVVGVEGVRAASVRARAAGVPLVGIGGITRARARELVGLVDAVAVVADLVPAAVGGDPLREVTARARELHGLFAPEPALASAVR
ncbi:MAG TPA: thiamine phosphate synthase [Polyangiaceae bacterium]|jgi:thiamine-phosphate pyrophosphorylase